MDTEPTTEPTPKSQNHSNGTNGASLPPAVKTKAKTKAKKRRPRPRPPVSLAELTLNPKQARVLAFMKKAKKATLTEMRHACAWKKGKDASWIRNSIRLPVKHKLIIKVDEGTYRLTAAGEKFRIRIKTRD